MKKHQETSEPTDYVELAEKNAGAKAVEYLIDKHLIQIMGIREDYPLDDLDLLSIELKDNYDIKRSVRREVGRLQEKIRLVIEAVTQRIADRKYRSTEQAIEGMKLSKNERTRFNALLNNDKRVHVSCQSLKVAVDVFLELNKRIIRKIEESEASDDKQTARRMILGNAIIVYELLDFIINYVDLFSISGIEEINEIYSNACDENKRLLGKENEREKRANSEYIIAEIREQIITDVQNRKGVIARLSEEWESYIKAINEKKDKTATINENLPSLKLMRDNAKGQIEVLQAALVLGIVKTNLGAIQSSMEALGKIELVTLSPDRIRILLGDA
ncbi:MAG: hypothetical protein DRI57_06430 [Deltaproteobacteria bacterium]|nr:MAG: hypothetical protein DRI57_06430 [Deltaproteobacteria bacterium]